MHSKSSTWLYATLLIGGALASAPTGWMSVAEAQEVTVVARNGDDIKDKVESAGEIGTFLVEAPPGVKLRLRVRSRSRSSGVSVSVLDAQTPSQPVIGRGRVVRLNFESPVRELHRVLVRADEPGATPNYEFSVRWRVPARERRELRPGFDEHPIWARFDASAGELLRVSFKQDGRRPSHSAPANLENEEGLLRPLNVRSTTRTRLERSGEHRVFVSKEAKSLPTHVILRRRPGRRRVDVRSSSIAALPANALVGGFSPQQGMHLDGSRHVYFRLHNVELSVPHDAVAGPGVIVLSEGEEIAQPVPGLQSYAVSAQVGPSDLKLRPGQFFTLELPVNIGQNEAGEPLLPRVFFRDLDGVVSEISPDRLRTEGNGPRVFVEHDRPGTFRGFFQRYPVRASAVAATDDRIIIGRPDAVIDGYANAGVVDVHQRTGNGWTLAAQIPAPHVRDDGEFGRALAVDGDRLVVGARNAVSTSGEPIAGYVFDRDVNGVWSLSQELIAKNDHLPFAPETFEATTPSFAIVGDVIVAGGFAPPVEWFRGRALVYERSAGVWSLTQVLREDRGAEDRPEFGAQVAMDANRLVLGTATTFTPLGEVLQYGAHVYTRSSGLWQLEQPLTLATDSGDCSQALTYFAPSALALEGDRIAIGASFSAFSSDPFEGHGLVAVFERSANGWSQRETLRAPQVPLPNQFVCPLSEFGASLSLRGGRLLVGAPTHGSDPSNENGAGGAFLFTFDPGGARLAQTFAPSVRLGREQFGRQVVILASGDTAVVGGVRSQDTGTSNELGRTLLFDLD